MEWAKLKAGRSHLVLWADKLYPVCGHRPHEVLLEISGNRVWTPLSCLDIFEDGLRPSRWGMILSGGEFPT